MQAQRGSGNAAPELSPTGYDALRLSHGDGPVTDRQQARVLPQSSRGISPALTLLFAVAAALAVANLYWAQPLLEEITHVLGVSSGSGGVLVTVTQIGYTLGVFLVVPLGDVLNRRYMVPTALVISALALASAALAPTFLVLLVALGLVGVSTVSAQILGPLASELAHPEQRGRVVGTIVSGALIGILLSRTISGVVADLFGWRAIYLCAAVAALTLAVILWRTIPELPPRPRIAYPVLLLSVLTTVRRYPAAQATLAISAINFGVFSLFWTALTFLLSAPPFNYTVSEIGLVGLAGLAGALAARRAGNLHDRGWSIPANGAALVLALLSLILAGLGGRSIVVLLIAIVLFDVAVQATTVLSQTRIFSLATDVRSRLNTALVTTNFIGAAIGSTLATILWQAGGWSAVTLGGVISIAAALVIWLTTRRTALVLPARAVTTTAEDPGTQEPPPTMAGARPQIAARS